MSKNSSQKHIFKELRKIFSGLSDEEFELFKAAMNHKDETFLFSGRIQFTLGSLITQVYEEANKENYKLLSERLVRLAEYVENGDYYAYSLLSGFSISNAGFLEDKEKLVTVYIPPIVLDHYRSE
ncbi:hypothetical protein ON064_03010 [Planococcus sp. A6]|uniref:hypothetical protein n=1 Tax=Planococcus sp. A6 TaxID=2992760 RepID=UPI00237C141F|nr:hypothetical protein [Planococcus sp. A6]MDE0582014.1 hypothetical protein [Planococcus sp. A6]